jgi:hypothetical protein
VLICQDSLLLTLYRLKKVRREKLKQDGFEISECQVPILLVKSFRQHDELRVIP